jgi:hypothetical protein
MASGSTFSAGKDKKVFVVQYKFQQKTGAIRFFPDMRYNANDQFIITMMKTRYPPCNKT